MINEFLITYRYGYYKTITSRVYAIDSERDLFLIADEHGNFMWVDMGECTLKED